MTEEDNKTIDFGFTPAGSISEFVWLDTDGDGKFDDDETGIPNVVVKLELPTGETITTTTSITGVYIFSELPFGSYTVTVDTTTLPPSLSQTYDHDMTLDHVVFDDD